MSHWSEAAGAMHGDEHKPPKVVDHVEVHHSGTKGDHIIRHHHTHPSHHPPEDHTTRGDDEMASHMMENMGSQNPGEEASDPTMAAQPGTPSAAPPTAAPSPTGSGAGGM